LLTAIKTTVSDVVGIVYVRRNGHVAINGSPV